MRGFELVRQYEGLPKDLQLHEEDSTSARDNLSSFQEDEFLPANFNAVAASNSRKKTRCRIIFIIGLIAVTTAAVGLILPRSIADGNVDNSDTVDLPTWQFQTSLQGWDPGDSVGDAIAVAPDGKSFVMGSTQTIHSNDVERFDTRGNVIRCKKQRDGSWGCHGNKLQGLKDDDGFGSSLDMTKRRDVEVLAVGSPQYLRNNENDSSGYVQTYDFDQTKEEWIPLGSRINGTDFNDGGGDGCFGSSVAFSWPILAVGDRCDDGNNDDKDANVGSVHIYVWNFTDWRLEQVLTGQDRGEQFGKPIALDNNGDVLVVTSLMNDIENDFSNIGKVQAYIRLPENDGHEWRPFGQALEGTAKDDWFGFALSINTIVKAFEKPRTFLAISSPYDPGSDNHSDFIRVYRHIDQGWQQIGQDLTSSDYRDRFGISLSLIQHPSMNDILLLGVGSHRTDSQSEQHKGFVDVFQYNISLPETDDENEERQWERYTAQLEGSPEGDVFSFSMVLSSSPSSLPPSNEDGKNEAISLIVRNSRPHMYTESVGTVHVYILSG